MRLRAAHPATQHGNKQGRDGRWALKSLSCVGELLVLSRSALGNSALLIAWSKVRVILNFGF
jgi:hypothetical protein